MTNQPKPEVKGIEQFRNIERYTGRAAAVVGENETWCKYSDRAALLAFAEEQQIYVVWWKKFAEDFESKKAAILELEAKAEEQGKEIERLRVALSLNCELHGCTSEHCTAAQYHEDAIGLINRMEAAESRLKAMEEVVEALVDDDAFAELCQDIGDEPGWLQDARIVLGRVG